MSILAQNGDQNPLVSNGVWQPFCTNTVCFVHFCTPSFFFHITPRNPKLLHNPTKFQRKFCPISPQSYVCVMYSEKRLILDKVLCRVASFKSKNSGTDKRYLKRGIFCFAHIFFSKFFFNFFNLIFFPWEGVFLELFLQSKELFHFPCVNCYECQCMSPLSRHLTYFYSPTQNNRCVRPPLAQGSSA